MTRFLSPTRLFFFFLAFSLCASFASGATRSAKRSSKVPARTAKARTVVKRVAPKKKATAVKTVSARTLSRSSKRLKAVPARSWRSARSTRSSKSRRRMASRRRGNPYVAGGPWLEPTFADSTAGDSVDGEDLVVRRAAVDALGGYNGTVVVSDPHTGRILTIVNQKVAFRGGFQPCSTIKVVTALAGLSERILDRDTRMHLYGRTSMTLTDALARSNNPYFANIGVSLGYDKIAHYAKMFGLGEKAGLDIPEETLGTFPAAPPSFGGMGMMTSFGEGIKLTPLQLVSVMSAVANGGTLYYLQYPRSEAEGRAFIPQVKRYLPIKHLLPELVPGLQGATEFGTARRAGFDSTEPIYGKTGTCTDRATPTHLGWFASFNEVNGRKLAIVVLLTGGRSVNGPIASGVAGQIYRTLSQQKFSSGTTQISSVAFSSDFSR